MTYSLDRVIDGLDRKIAERRSFETKLQNELDDHKAQTERIVNDRASLIRDRDQARGAG